tara:strand:+ start:760 stop:921 length:162 start_codon:yes stop_codon:yes gene_type:complete
MSFFPSRKSREHIQVINQNLDAVETYFECLTTCSIDDGECVTECVEKLKESDF